VGLADCEIVSWMALARRGCEPPLADWVPSIVPMPTSTLDLEAQGSRFTSRPANFGAPGIERIRGWEDVTIDPRTGVPEYAEAGVWPSTTLAWRRRSRRLRYAAGTPWDVFGDDLKLELGRRQRVPVAVRSLRGRLSAAPSRRTR
jgi:hypothetical protein